jgi:nicotinate-nucleotide adenylyltransferase
MSQTKKIGIFSGTFDPIHHGHISFARKAAHQLGLDKVYFLVEPQPRRKSQASDIRHRLNMMWLALQDYPELELLPMDHLTFNVADTLPWLEEKFAGAELHLLLGSDLFAGVHNWPGFETLKRHLQFVVGQRRQDDTAGHPIQHQAVTTDLSQISSSLVRGLRGEQMAGLVPETVAQYIDAQKPYKLASAAAASDSAASSTSSSVSKSL